jgi:hypothetical protein
MPQLANANKNALNRVGRLYFEATGTQFGDFIQDMLDSIDAGGIGITADAWDVDSLARGGGAFSIDGDNTVGLTFAWLAGRIWTDPAGYVEVAAGSVLLTGSATNYVEVSPAGVVSANAVAFTTGSVPLYKVVTGVASITTATPYKPLLRAPAGKVIELAMPTINATTTVRAKAPGHAAKLKKLTLIVGTTIAASDATYWSVTVTNKQGGAGNVTMLAVSDANTTKATGGSAFTADTVRSFTLHGTPANLATAADDALQITFTKNGAAADIVGATVVLEF